MAKYGMVIDLDRCSGCRACMVACKVENNTPEGIYWMNTFRFEEGEFPQTKIWFMPRPCMHCEYPACVPACPTEARFQREDGIVATDTEACIGCRYCQAACPYGVNYYNWVEPETNYYMDWSDADLIPVTNGASPPYANPDLQETYGSENKVIAGGGHQQGVIEKCTFCVHRVEQGMQPACVDVCPTFALHFGDLDDPESEVAQLLEEKSSYQLLDEFGTSPKVFYVGSNRLKRDTREIEKVGGGA